MASDSYACNAIGNSVGVGAFLNRIRNAEKSNYRAAHEKADVPLRIVGRPPEFDSSQRDRDYWIRRS